MTGPHDDREALDGSEHGPTVPVPDGLSESEERAFVMGYQMCAQMVQRAVGTWAKSIAHGSDGDESDEQEQEQEDCTECGARLRQGLGGTKVCPDCQDFSQS